MNTKKLNRGYEALVREFKKPGCEFRGKPFWSWNGELEEKELKRQVDVMKEMGFGGYFMHSRAGLITEYLGDEWFDLCNKVAEYGKETGMEPWLYDEDRWPSGCAGGIVTRDPKYRMKSLVLFEGLPERRRGIENLLYKFEALISEKDGTLVKYRPYDGNTVLEAGEGLKHRILYFAVVYDQRSSGYNGTTYIDTMMKAATEKFIELTHQEYKNRAGEVLWKEIKGIFTDEPHRGHLLDDASRDADGLLRCSICWTDDIFDEFKKRYGYDVTEHLPELFYKAPGYDTSFAVKHDYVDLANNLFIERFADPINDWCVKNGIDFTGHVLHEDSLTNQTVPNGSLMRFYGHMGVPGIDNLSEWATVFWAAKQIQSAARQLGKKWLLSELYGCTGWQFNFRSHKAVGDWQALYGITLRCPHLSWYTMEGEAKRDYPASILHQSPYYKDYSYVEDYFARFGVVMSEGKDVCEVLVLNPIETIWTDIYAGWARWIMPADGEVNALEENYRKLFGALTDANVDFDYGEEQMLSELARVEVDEQGPKIVVGKGEYRTVVLSGAKTVRRTTLNLLEDFAKKGGKVVVLGDEPEMIDAKKDDGFRKLSYDKAPLDSCSVKKLVKSRMKVKVSFENEKNCKLHVRVADAREKDGIVTLAAVNVDRGAGAENVKLILEGIDGIKGCAEWCLEDGGIYPVKDYTVGDGKVSIVTDFFPAGERIFVFYCGKEMPEFSEADHTGRREKLNVVAGKELGGSFDYILDEKNAMALDFATADLVTNDGREKHFDVDEILRIDMAVRDFTGLEHRGGGMLQPWYARKYANESIGKITVSYEFDVETVPEGEVLICGERPEFGEYRLNGKKLTPDGSFWVDNCFKTMPVPSGLLMKGKNVVTYSTVFRRTTNLESVYLVGDFGVKSELLEKNPAKALDNKGNIYSRNKTVTVLPEKLTLDNITDQNLLMYTGRVSYIVTPEMLKDVVPGKGERAVIRVPDYVGSLVRIETNDGKKVAVLGWEPYTADVTELLKEGFRVTLVCSRKNIYGPLHFLPAIPGAVGPGHFVAGGAAYTENYALMDSNPGKIYIDTVKI
ncbi:MAG: hypothetical protein K6G89_05700 [Clostridia bacterium]|nr:hypothetical protein [Clostridia bacterium]